MVGLGLQRSSNHLMSKDTYWTSQKVIPVVIIENANNAVPMAKALVKAGINKIEITLRTSAALDAIHRINSEVPKAIVGAGTILNTKNGEQAIKAGAKFLVSPGSTEELLNFFNDSGVRFLPGCATVSEAMRLSELGISVAKFFPAEESGGVNFLKGVSSVLQKISFCPTGGINKLNYKKYLDLPNVVCVGGSWISPASLIESENWDEIIRLASEIKGV